MKNEILNRLELQKQADILLKQSYSTKGLESIALQQQADALLQQSYYKDEKAIADLLNNTTHRHATGKLAQYKILLGTCKFKAALYFDVDKYGRQYTVAEKKNRDNLKHLPSNDAQNGVTNHQIGFEDLIEQIWKYTRRLDAAQVFYVDRLAGYEYMIANINTQNVMKSTFVPLLFKKSELTGSIIFDKIDGQPLRTDKIRVYKPKK